MKLQGFERECRFIFLKMRYSNAVCSQALIGKYTISTHHKASSPGTFSGVPKIASGLRLLFRGDA